MYCLKNYKVKYACYAPQFGDCIVFICELSNELNKKSYFRNKLIQFSVVL